MNGRFLWLMLVGAIGCVLLAIGVPSVSDDATSGKPMAHQKAIKADRGGDPHHDSSKRVRLPFWWKADDPIPGVKSNCVRCHLTAGRELTAPVQDFARSVHDFMGMTCSDCHGGNRDSDPQAHEEVAGFIGTKLSAHMANCAGCHADQFEQVRRGPHFWDFNKKINLKYPVCSDCHGHHDVNKPPAEFTLTNVCSECHKRFSEQMPVQAAIVGANDRLWDVLRKVQEKNVREKDPLPGKFRPDVDHARKLTAALLHPAGRVTQPDADRLNAEVARLRAKLERWLAEGGGISSKGSDTDAK